MSAQVKKEGVPPRMIEVVAVAVAWFANFWSTQWENIRCDSRCDCKCTCEVNPVVCPSNSWWWEILKIVVWVLTGIVVGAGRSLFKWVCYYLRTGDTPTESEIPAHRAAIDSGTTGATTQLRTVQIEDQKSLAQQQLLALRQKQALKK